MYQYLNPLSPDPNPDPYPDPDPPLSTLETTAPIPPGQRITDADLQAFNPSPPPPVASSEINTTLDPRSIASIYSPHDTTLSDTYSYDGSVVGSGSEYSYETTEMDTDDDFGVGGEEEEEDGDSVNGFQLAALVIAGGVAGSGDEAMSIGVERSPQFGYVEGQTAISPSTLVLSDNLIPGQMVGSGSNLPQQQSVQGRSNGNTRMSGAGAGAGSTTAGPLGRPKGSGNRKLSSVRGKGAMTEEELNREKREREFLGFRHCFLQYCFVFSRSLNHFCSMISLTSLSVC